MKRFVIRPFSVAQALLVFLALLLICCGVYTIIYALGRGSIVEKVFYLVVFILVGGTLPTTFLYFAFRRGITFYEDHLVIVKWKNSGKERALFPKVDKTAIQYREIKKYGTFLLNDLIENATGIDGLRDVFAFLMNNGEIRIVDFETYSDAQQEHLMFELEARTRIWPEGRVLPKERHGQLLAPMIRAFGNLLGVILIFIVLPVAMIWLEGWINPAHPPNFNSGWRTAYLLTAMFASFAVMGWIASKRRSKQKTNDMLRKIDHSFYIKFGKVCGIIALMMHAIFVVLFIMAVLA